MRQVIEFIYHPMFWWVLSILGLFYAYLGWRLVHPLNVKPTIKRAAALWLILSWLSSLLPIMLNGLRGEFLWVTWVSSLVYLNLGFFSLILPLLLLFDLAHGLVFLGILVKNKIKILVFKDQQPSKNPRGILLRGNRFSLGLMLLAAPIFLIGSYNALSPPQIKPVEITYPALHPDLQGLTILQLSDLHLGDFLGQEFTQDLVARSRELKPDLVVLLGDLGEGRAAYLREELAPLSKMEATWGKFFVTGNHEYFGGKKDWVQAVRGLGYQVLENRHHILLVGGAKLLVAGVSDPMAEEMDPQNAPDLDKALEGQPDADFRLLLAHQPMNFSSAVKAGFDLQLSGHTHGGQYYPWLFFAVWVNGYLKGLHQEGDARLYVGQGTGFWGPPIRLGSKSEITLITLTLEEP